MGYLETADLAEAKSFRRRLVPCLVDAAAKVMAEPQGEMTLTQYAKRVDLARNVLRAPEAIIDAFMWPVLSNAAIAASGLETPDTDLCWQVMQVWDLAAGVTQADATASTESTPTAV